MADLQLDASGDLLLNDENTVQVVDGPEGVRQAWASRLRTFRGEWFRDTRLGVPYQQWADGAPLLVIQGQLRELTLGTAGIGSVREVAMQFDGSTRKLTGRIRARLEDGTDIVLQASEPLIFGTGEAS